MAVTSPVTRPDYAARMSTLRFVPRPTRQPAAEPFLADLARVLDVLEAHDPAGAPLDGLRLAVERSLAEARRGARHADVCQCEACAG
jgi:hypothetical protein